MSDPIAGGAIQKSAQIAREMEQNLDAAKPGGPSKFDAVMDQMANKSVEGAGSVNPAQNDGAAMKNALEQPLQRQIDQIPATERTRLRVDMEQNLQGKDQSDQVRYFAERIENTRGGMDRLEERAAGADLGAFQNKMVDRLEDLRVNQGQLDRFLADFSGGKSFSQEELLAVQIKCHQMAQSVELLSKTVEHGVGGMKTIFQTNV
ncbi:MAG: hypothetical protein IT349_19715 [Candidatus Eisenbacteria bacterium]|nr:hypothetical protein [Candidatus Eisenbacteria bacterium]MCC7144330.1 hypothetical protein [Candidatus Eisenbacteria bacterium]